MIACLRCKHLIGIDIDGNVHCHVFGKIKPMLMCTSFKEKKKGEKQ